MEKVYGKTATVGVTAFVVSAGAGMIQSVTAERKAVSSSSAEPAAAAASSPTVATHLKAGLKQGLADAKFLAGATFMFGLASFLRHGRYGKGFFSPMGDGFSSGLAVFTGYMLFMQRYPASHHLCHQQHQQGQGGKAALPASTPAMSGPAWLSPNMRKGVLLALAVGGVFEALPKPQRAPAAD